MRQSKFTETQIVSILKEVMNRINSYAERIPKSTILMGDSR